MKLIKKILMILCLLSLIGCSRLVQTKYIKPEIPDIPEKPEYYDVQWFKIDSNYCVNKENAKNLLKNKAIDDAYQQKLRLILQSLR